MSEESNTITATAISEFDRQIEASNDRREARIQQIEAVNRELKLLAEQKAALLEQAEQMWQRIAAEEERIDRTV
jgi:predicted  nucleic acid-binding Zn-ribbon protein